MNEATTTLTRAALAKAPNKAFNLIQIRLDTVLF